VAVAVGVLMLPLATALTGAVEEIDRV